MGVVSDFIDFFRPAPQDSAGPRKLKRKNKRFIGDDFPLASDFRDAIRGNVFTYTQMNAIRRLVQKSPFLQGYQEQMGLNVVGEMGPTPTFQTITNKTDRRKVKELWDEWTEKVGVSGNADWPTVIKTLVRSFAVDGRTFAIIKNHPRYKFGIAIQAVSREWLAESWEGIRPVQKTVNGQTYDFLNGVYYDQQSGQIAGYEFYKSIVLPPLNNLPIPMTRERVFVNSMYVCDFSCVNSPYNYDHIPEGILSVLTLLSNIADLDESTTQLMRIATHYMGFIEKDAEADQLFEIEDYEPISEIEANIIENLPVGHKFKSFSPHAPNGDISNYRKEMLKNAAATLGLDHATLTGDLEKVNYSSLRPGVIAARDAFKNHQKLVESKVCRKILAVWLDEMIMTGRLKFTNTKSIEQAKRTKWRHRSYQWVDPQKDAIATKQLIAMGVTSPQRVATGMGVDYLQILDEVREFLDEMAAREITPADLQALSGATMAVRQEAENGEDESETEEQESPAEEGEQGEETEDTETGGGGGGDQPSQETT